MDHYLHQLLQVIHQNVKEFQKEYNYIYLKFLINNKER